MLACVLLLYWPQVMGASARYMEVRLSVCGETLTVCKKSHS